ncbi:MAG: RimK family protein [Verrucomicrobia bacterium]|nr:RimK family protein [Verrucomicrobiota bacterium]MDA1068005.1 RimK family protein [Verrucomicrobiota bacterium]
MKTLVVVERPSTWKVKLPAGVEILTPKSYITDPAIQKLRRARVYNLCRDYSYQSAGYYVSLLAEARGHRPLPLVSTLRKVHGRLINPSREFQATAHRSLEHIQHDEFVLSVYFSRNLAKRHDRLALAVFKLFPAPLMRAVFRRGEDGDWRMRSVNLISAKDIPESHMDFVQKSAEQWFARPKRLKAQVPARFTLGILVDPKEATPPSDSMALKKFLKSAERHNLAVEMLEPDDIDDVEELDALFIRATTSVENFTFRFARRATQARIPTIDDPDSILRCTNKVFLAELFDRNGISAPKTEILYTTSNPEIPKGMSFPLVLKQPDSSFSLGVVKVNDEAGFRKACQELFEKTDLLIAQEFLPTQFDWRIGILDRKPIYACRYFMARGHWQIYDRGEGSKGIVAGNADTFPLGEVPAFVLDTALRAANLIGDGLYGVDLKEINGQALVIEVNDNPSIDSGVEDAVIKDELYDCIIRSFIKRVEGRTGVNPV